MDKVNKHSCCLCEKSFREKERIRSLENYDALLNFVMANKLVHLFLHNGCYMKLYNRKRNAENDTKNQESLTPDSNGHTTDVGTRTDFALDNTTNQFRTTNSYAALPNEDIIAASTTTSSKLTMSTPHECMELPFYRLSKANKICSICGKNFSFENILSQEVDQSTRVEWLLGYRVYIPIGNRCCSTHHTEKRLNTQYIGKMQKNKQDHCIIKKDELITILDEVKKELRCKNDHINQLNKSPPLNFDDCYMPMSNTNYQVLTGLTRDQFNDLCSEIPASALRHTEIRSARTAIACLLVQLRLGLSHETLCTLFSIEDKRKMSRILDCACAAIKRYFVPKHLGFDHIETSKVIADHTRPLAKILLGKNDSSKAILILDGTYCYIQKSSNNLLQRRTYSLHKGRPLVKPMMIVSTDGYIISTIGRFLADGLNNDAELPKI